MHLTAIDNRRLIRMPKEKTENKCLTTPAPLGKYESFAQRLCFTPKTYSFSYLGMQYRSQPDPSITLEKRRLLIGE